MVNRFQRAEETELEGVCAANACRFQTKNHCSKRSLPQQEIRRFAHISVLTVDGEPAARSIRPPFAQMN